MSLRIELALREKRDADGRPYLFAPIPMLNAVCFVFEEPPRAGIKRAKIVIKPYEANREFRTPWGEEEERGQGQEAPPAPHGARSRG